MLDRLQSFRVEGHETNRPRVIHIDSESARQTIKAISSETARKILAVLHDDPRPPSQVASAVDTSIANVNYHLDNLQQAELIADVDTWYSEKGREMAVYAPTDDPIVLSGTEDGTGQVQSLLKGVGVAVTLLALASLFVNWIVTELLVSPERTEIIRRAAPAGAIQGVNLTPVSPGLLFFTGGTFVLTLVVLVWSVVGRFD